MFDILINAFSGMLGSCGGNLLSTRIENLINSPEKIDGQISINHPPRFNGKLIGRKLDIKRLNKSLYKNQCVWISSIGGIGKSTLAMVYARKYRLKYRKTYWLSWKGNLQDTLNDKINIHTNGDLISQDQNIYDKIIYYFREQVPKSGLLIIDGLDQYNAEEVKIISSFRCKILITSRICSNLHAEQKLDVIDNEHCRKLFENEAGIKISDQNLQRILSLTGKHTLAIKLLARYAKCYSIEQLFVDILAEDIAHINNKIQIEDGEPASTIIAYFTRIYTIKCSGFQKNLLMNLAILPSNDLKISDLNSLIGIDISEGWVSELENLGWLISRRYKSVYLHPILSSTIRQIIIDENIDSSVFQKMLEKSVQLSSASLDEFDDYDNLSYYLEYYESIIHYYWWENSYIAQLMVNSSYIRFIQEGGSKSSLKNVEKARSILERIYSATPVDENAKRQYARVLSDISEFYYKDSCKEAIKIEEEALRLKKSLPDVSQDTVDADKTLDLLKSYSNLMLYHHDNFDYNYVDIAKEVIANYQEEIKKYKRTQVNILNHFALMLRFSNQRKEGVLYLEKAIKIIEESNSKDYYIYPMLLNTLGALCGEVIEYGKIHEEYLSKQERSKYIKRALKNLYRAYYLKKQRYLKYHKPISSIAITQHNIADVWSKLGFYWIALFYENRALKTRQAIYKDGASEELNLASSLLRLGIICAAIYEKYRLNHFKKLGVNHLNKASGIYRTHRNENPDANCEKEISKCEELIKELNNSSQ